MPEDEKRKSCIDNVRFDPNKQNVCFLIGSGGESYVE